MVEGVRGASVIGHLTAASGESVKRDYKMPGNVAAGKDTEKEKSLCPYSCQVLSVKLEKQTLKWESQTVWVPMI